jgi:DNA polymerase-3 subunit alpha
VKAASEYQDIFGKDRYFLELMDHGIDIEHRVREDLLRVGKKLGIPPLVTNDSHYTYGHEATAHDALLCIQTGKNKFDGTGYYLKSTDEMYAVDSSDAWQEDCANTLLVAEQIDTSGMFEAKNLMPRFDIPDGFTEVTWFQEEVRRGMERRFPGGIPDDRQKQAEYEMDVIRWGSRGTSSSSPTSSCGRRARASRSAPAAVPPPARSSRTPWASPTSTRSRTA